MHTGEPVNSTSSTTSTAIKIFLYGKTKTSKIRFAFKRIKKNNNEKLNLFHVELKFQLEDERW